MSRPLSHAARAACAAVAALLAIGSAQAATISFASQSGTRGTSQAYGPITAYGFDAPTSGPRSGVLSAANLYGKADGAGETGLGLATGDDHEIDAPAGSEAIVLDVSALIGQDLGIGFGSVQGGEGWRVGFSSSASLPGNESAFSGYVSSAVDFPSLYDLGVDHSRYLVAEATAGNVLLSSLSANSVPEPASLAVLAVGLLGLCLVWRRRSRA